MNLAITTDIAARTNATITYDIDPITAVTTYHVTKPVNGVSITVSVTAAAEYQANHNAATIAAAVTKRAAELFSENRKKSEKVK